MAKKKREEEIEREKAEKWEREKPAREAKKKWEELPEILKAAAYAKIHRENNIRARVDDTIIGGSKRCISTNDAFRDGGTYFGNYTSEDVPHGYGVYSWMGWGDYGEGSYRYVGQWENGKEHGQGTEFEHYFNPDCEDREYDRFMETHHLNNYGDKLIRSGEWVEGSFKKFQVFHGDV